MQQPAKLFEERSTYVSTSTPNTLPYSLDSIAEECYLSRGKIVVLVVKTSPLLLLIKNYKILISEICSFFSGHTTTCFLSLQSTLPGLISWFRNPGPLQAVFLPQNPKFWACQHRIHQEYYLLTYPAILPFPPHSVSEDDHGYLLLHFLQDPLAASNPLLTREFFSINHFARPHFYSL